MNTHYDVVIIGAGLNGLAAAKTFLEIDPALRLTIVDSNASIGGVWALSNLYDGLRTNNLVGGYEYTDFPMDETFGVQHADHIPGAVVFEYLRRYAEDHDLMERVQFKTKLAVAEKMKNGWRLGLETAGKDSDSVNDPIVRSPQLPERRHIICTKLVVATGLTCAPAPIGISGKDRFEVPIINFREFAHKAAMLYDDESIKSVAVSGGGKSAHDAVYLMASHGKHVDWIIRKSGYGPTYTAPSHVYLGPFRCRFEKLPSIRPLTWLSPNVWGAADGFGYVRSFLHGTRLGRWIVNAFWNKTGSDLIAQTHVTEHKETTKLKSDQAPFWYGTNLSILNYPTDFYEYVRNGQVTVLRKDILNLDSQGSIRFDDGTSVKTNALICSTGWKFTCPIDFRPKEIHADLGIPSKEYSGEQNQIWDTMNAQADFEIFQRYPKLKEGLKFRCDTPLFEETTLQNEKFAREKMHRKVVTPWRLWRGIVPPSLRIRDIAFVGNLHTIQSAVQAEICSLWAYAYMFGRLTDPLMSISQSSGPLKCNIESSGGEGEEQEKVLYDTALFNRFGMRRAPYGFGSRYPDLVFDGLPYFDLLLRDLGLKHWRKGWGWLGEVLGGIYEPADYIGLVQEWKQTQKMK